MYLIQKNSYGYKIVFSGQISAKEMLDWYHEAAAFLENQAPGFGVLIDLRELKPLAQDVQKILVEGQELFKTKGIARTAVVLVNSILADQFKRFARNKEMHAWERYLDCISTPNFEKISEDWIVNGKDPYKK